MLSLLLLPVNLYLSSLSSTRACDLDLQTQQFPLQSAKLIHTINKNNKLCVGEALLLSCAFGPAFMILYGNNITILSIPLPVDRLNYFGLTSTLNVADLFTFGDFNCLCPYKFISRSVPHCNINLSPSLSHPVFSSEETYSSIFVFHRLGRISEASWSSSAQSQARFDVISDCSGSCAVDF